MSMVATPLSTPSLNCGSAPPKPSSRSRRIFRCSSSGTSIFTPSFSTATTSHVPWMPRASPLAGSAAASNGNRATTANGKRRMASSGSFLADALQVPDPVSALRGELPRTRSPGNRTEAQFQLIALQLVEAADEGLAAFHGGDVDGADPFLRAEFVL